MLPKRTASAVPIVNDLSSPSGHMSKQARKAAEKRLSLELFGPGGIPPVKVKQPAKAESLRRRAEQMRHDARCQPTERRYLNRMKAVRCLLAEADAWKLAHSNEPEHWA